MSRKMLRVGLFCLFPTLTLLIVYSTPIAKRIVFNNSKTIAAPAPVQTSDTIIDFRQIALQPEAAKLIRRLGSQRFNARPTQALILTGVLTTDKQQQDVQIARRQDATGERVEVSIADKAGSLAWDAVSGAASSRSAINLTERVLLERLTFDSADQFILAQLRGASYFVVARNVRPDDAPDNYSGPLWDVVRIDDPEQDEQKRPLSRWRLYYLNSTTGLIDKVVSEIQGERVEANLSEWTVRNDEKFPATITWTRQGQILMRFTLTNVSLVAQSTVAAQ